MFKVDKKNMMYVVGFLKLFLNKKKELKMIISWYIAIQKSIAKYRNTFFQSQYQALQFNMTQTPEMTISQNVC